MFGYIQPLKCELKVREYDYYRAAYCGLCSSLRTRCGIKARFIVNYDFVFIALLLSYAENFQEKTAKKRCIVCPKGRNCIQSAAYDRAADISVILTYLKLCDDVEDKGFLTGLFKARIPRMLLKKAYKRAALSAPEYNLKARGLYEELCTLEKNKEPSIDKTADKFALMLAEIADGNKPCGRILGEMFYHIGRFVYIIDALDDFQEDFRRGEYNPIISRFNVTSILLPDAVKENVLTTLEDSRLAVLRAFELLDESNVKNLIRNIIELGMNASVHRVVKKEKSQ